MLLDPLLMANAVDKTAEVSSSGETTEVLTGQLEGVLSGMDAYSTQIGAHPQADLKGAYATLEEISGELTKLREQNPELTDRHPELGAVVNELEVMTVTERFKLNRGDYL